MAASLQIMESWQQAALIDWARQQGNDRLAMLWKQLTVAISYYKPQIDSLDVANAIAARLEVVRIEVESREGLLEESFEPCPWYKTVNEKATWTLRDFTKLPADTEFTVQANEVSIENQGSPLNPLLQLLDATNDNTLSDATREPGSIFDTLLHLDDATIQIIQEIADASETTLSLEPMDTDATMDAYEVYRLSDKDMSGLPIISCRMTPSAADIWLADSLFSSPTSLRPALPYNARSTQHAASRQFTLEAPQNQGATPFVLAQLALTPNHPSTLNSIHKDLNGRKRRADWIDDGMPGPVGLPFTTADAHLVEHTQGPAPKRQKTRIEPPARTATPDDSIIRVLDKKKGKWLVEYTANTKSGRAVAAKWLNYSHGKRIPQSIRDEYYKGAWGKLVNKIEENKGDR